MTPTDLIKERIGFKQIEVTRLLGYLEETRNGYLGALGPHIYEGVVQGVRSKTEEAVGRTRGLSDSELKALKQATHKLADKARAEIVSAVSEDHLWWHTQSPLPNVWCPLEAVTQILDQGKYPSKQEEADLDEACGWLRCVVNSLDQLSESIDRLLSSFGYEVSPHVFKSCEQTRSALKRYTTDQYVALDLLEEIEKLNKEMSLADVRDRWDSL